MLRLVLLEAWLVWRTTCNTPQNSVPSQRCDLCEATLLICWEINSSSCGFIHFINTTHFYVCSRFLELSRFRDDGLPNAGFGWLSFTWCSRSRWCLQLSPCILDDILVIFVTWINRINSCQISGIMEFWFLDGPLLLLSFLSCFSNPRPSVRPYVMWMWCRVNFCQSPPGPHVSFWKSLVQFAWILWILSAKLTNFCFRRHSNNHQFVFLVQRPNLY